MSKPQSTPLDNLFEKDAPSEIDRLTSETATLRERVKDLCAVVKDSIDECEGMIASEKLGGNIVKEEFWKGRITALRFVEHLLANIHSTKGSQ